MAIIARFFLFLQMGTVFPLLIFIFRVQFLYVIFKVKDYPGFLYVLALNAITITVCTIVAIVYPKVKVLIAERRNNYIFIGGRYYWMVGSDLRSGLYIFITMLGEFQYENSFTYFDLGICNDKT